MLFDLLQMMVWTGLFRLNVRLENESDSVKAKFSCICQALTGAYCQSIKRGSNVADRQPPNLADFWT